MTNSGLETHLPNFLLQAAACYRRHDSVLAVSFAEAMNCCAGQTPSMSPSRVPACGGLLDWLQTPDWFDMPLREATAPLPPGGFIHHRAWESHATRTDKTPLLALWGWGGSIGMGSYRMNQAEN